MVNGDLVQTRFGKGVVREVRNHGRLLVDVQGRAIEMASEDVTPVEEPRRGRGAGKGRSTPATASDQATVETVARTAHLVEVDLHGLTVEAAIARVDEVLNDALLAGADELRIIHGRSGGRLRSAVRARLGEIGSIRGFRVDPHNAGVTIVQL